MPLRNATGLHRAGLLPAFDDGPYILDRLHDALRRADTLRGAVAYVSGHSEIDLPLLASRARGRGFLCADLRLPTDLHWLLKLHNAGARVFLHLTLPQDPHGAPKLPSGLLHTKTLLFDQRDRPSVAWVGSHNWSRRALRGPNVELSLALHLSRNAPVYKDLRKTLHAIRDLCVPFNPDDMELYKKLQGEKSDDEMEMTLALRCTGTRPLHRVGVTLFGRDRAGLQALPRVQRYLLVDMEHRYRGETIQRFYRGRVLHSGELTGNGAGLTFDQRRLAVQDGGEDRPHLKAAAVPDAALLAEARWWVTVDVLEELEDVEEVDFPDNADRLLCETDNHPLLNRMRPEDLDRGAKRKPWTVKEAVIGETGHANAGAAALGVGRERTASPLRRMVVRRRR